MLRDALLENLHRAQLNPLEEASAYQQLLEDFGCTHDELAARIGRSRPQISNTIRLLKLGPAVQRKVAAGVLSAGHARSLLAVEDLELQDRLATRVIAEGISVRGLEEIVAVGDTGSPAVRRVTRAKPTAPGLTELADRLSDRLETRVKVDLGRTKGRITVEFASLDDLRRIVDVMDPLYRKFGCLIPRELRPRAHDGRSLRFAGFAVRRRHRGRSRAPRAPRAEPPSLYGVDVAIYRLSTNRLSR